MPRYQLPLIANQRTRAPYGGRVLQIIDTGLASTVRLEVEFSSTEDAENLGQVDNKFKLRATQKFLGLALTSPVDTTVDMLVTLQDITVNQFAGSTINAILDPAQFPLPVTVDGPDPLPVSFDWPDPLPVSFADEELPSGYTASSHSATDVEGIAFYGAANYKRVVIHNHGPGDVAISRNSPGLGFDERAIILSTGQTMVEERFAGVAMPWSLICRAGETAELGVEVWFSVPMEL